MHKHKHSTYCVANYMNITHIYKLNNCLCIFLFYFYNNFYLSNYFELIEINK